MELNDAIGRIVRHWPLIVVAVLIGAVIGAIAGDRTGGYTAATRLVLDAPDPKARAESTAIADTARAIVTSPSLVSAALARAGVSSTDSARYAANDVTVSALGTSGVLDLAVRADTPRLAADVSNALARELIRTRNAIASDRANGVQQELNTRIAALNERISRLDPTIASLSARVALGRTGSTAASQQKLGDSSRLRDFLTQQRSTLETEQASLLSASSAGPAPSIISPATAAEARSAGSSFLPDAVLGGLLGLIAGVGIAALINATFEQRQVTESTTGASNGDTGLAQAPAKVGKPGTAYQSKRRNGGVPAAVPARQRQAKRRIGGARR